MDEQQKTIRDCFEVKITIRGRFSVIHASDNEIESLDDITDKVETDMDEWLTDYFDTIDNVDVEIIQNWQEQDGAPKGETENGL